MNDPEVTDRQRLIELLESFGIQKVDGPLSGKLSNYCETETAVELGSGIGYPDFCCNFYFDADGKFTSYGCYE